MTNLVKTMTFHKKKKNTSVREKRMIWSDEETEQFLNLMIKKRNQTLLDGKLFKTTGVLHIMVKEMSDAGFSRSFAQLHTKYKNLKYSFYECRRQNLTSHRAPSYCPFYDLLQNLLGALPDETTLVGPGFDSTEFADCFFDFDEENINSQAVDSANVDFYDRYHGSKDSHVPGTSSDISGFTSSNTTENCDRKISQSSTIGKRTMGRNSRPSVDYDSTDSESRDISEEEKLNSTTNLKRKCSSSKTLLLFGEKNIAAQKELQKQFFEHQEKLENKMLQQFLAGQQQLLQQFLENIGNVLNNTLPIPKRSRQSSHTPLLSSKCMPESIEDEKADCESDMIEEN